MRLCGKSDATPGFGGVQHVVQHGFQVLWLCVAMHSRPIAQPSKQAQVRKFKEKHAAGRKHGEVMTSTRRKQQNQSMTNAQHEGHIFLKEENESQLLELRKYGWAKNDYYPEATRVRACITFSDSATSGSLQLRMIHAHRLQWH